MDCETAGYDISFFGDVEKFLGIACKYDRKLGTLTLDQKEYIDEILHNFKMEKCKGVNSPMIHKPTQNDCPGRRFKELQIKETLSRLTVKCFLPLIFGILMTNYVSNKYDIINIQDRLATVSNYSEDTSL